MYLIGLGDSWANGAELNDDERPFAAVLANQMQAKYIHVAQDAASIPHLILQLKSALAKIPKDNIEPVLAVFLLTASDRDIMWSSTRPKGTGFMHEYPPPYNTPEVVFLNGNDPLHRDWFLEYHSAELAQYRTNTTILALQKICQHHNIRDYWAWAWNSVHLWPEVNTTRFYRHGLHPMNNTEFSSAKVNQLIGHPDQMQHYLIAERFAKLIQSSQTIL